MKQYTLDWNSVLGDTILERYESVYLKIVEITKDVGKLRAMLASNLIASIFETATVGFSASDTIAQIGHVTFCGKLNYHDHGSHIHLYKTGPYIVVPTNELLLFGERGSAVLTFENFII